MMWFAINNPEIVGVASLLIFLQWSFPAGLRIESVRDKWRPVVLAYVTHFPAEEMQQELIQFALELSDPAEPPDLRKLCCEIIGALFPRLSRWPRWPQLCL